MHRRHLFPAWIAALAIFFSALAPAWAQAFETAPYDIAMADICRADRGAGAGHKAPDKAPLHHALAHCPFCATHASIALLPPLPVALPQVAGHDHYPSLFYRSPAPLFSWAAAQPRGPPALS